MSIKTYSYMMKLLNDVRFNRALMLTFCAIIFTLSSIPGTSYPEIDIPNIDKSVHILLYMPFGLLIQNMARLTHGRFPFYIKWLMLMTLFAALDEVHQYFVPNRSCDIVDYIFDNIGMLLGIFLLKYFIFYTKHYQATHNNGI